MKNKYDVLLRMGTKWTRTSLPFTLTPTTCPSFSSQAILLLLPIVSIFFFHLILLSSFSALLRGAALLSIFIMRPGKKADGRTEQKRAAIPVSTIATLLSSPSLVLPASSSLFILPDIPPSITASLLQFPVPKRVHFSPSVSLTLCTFLYLNFYFSLFTALYLSAVFFSLTPTTICSFFSL